MIRPNGSDPNAKLVSLGITSSIVLWANTAQAQRRSIADETLSDERSPFRGDKIQVNCSKSVGCHLTFK